MYLVLNEVDETADAYLHTPYLHVGQVGTFLHTCLHYQRN